MTLNVHCIFHVEWFTVEVGGTFFLAIDYRCRRTECVYKGVGIDVSGKQVDTYHGFVKRGACVYDGDVEQPVCKAGVGGDIGVVAILRGVATRYEKRFFSEYLAVGAYGVDLRVVFDVFRNGAFQIGELASFALTREVAADSCVKSYPECAEEMPAVDRPVIAFQQVVFSDYVGCELRVKGYAEVARKTVA